MVCAFPLLLILKLKLLFYVRKTNLDFLALNARRAKRSKARKEHDKIPWLHIFSSDRKRLE